jgi:hypothetical protein
VEIFTGDLIRDKAFKEKSPQEVTSESNSMQNREQ